MNEDEINTPSFGGADVIVVPGIRKSLPSVRSKVLKRLFLIDDDAMDGSEFMPCKFRNSFDDQSTAPLETEHDSFSSASPVAERSASSDSTRGHLEGMDFVSKKDLFECSDTDSYNTSTSGSSSRAHARKGSVGEDQLVHQQGQRRKPSWNGSYSYPAMKFVPNKSGPALQRLVKVLETKTPAKTKEKRPPRGRSLSPRWVTSSRTTSYELEAKSPESAPACLGQQSSACLGRLETERQSLTSSDTGGFDELDSSTSSRRNVIRLVDFMSHDFWSPESSLCSHMTSHASTWNTTRLRVKQPNPLNIVPSWANSLIMPKKEPSYERKTEMKKQKEQLATLLAKALELQDKPRSLKDNSSKKRAPSNTKSLQTTFKRALHSVSAIPKTALSPVQKKPNFDSTVAYKRVSSSSVQRPDANFKIPRGSLLKKPSSKRKKGKDPGTHGSGSTQQTQ